MSEGADIAEQFEKHLNSPRQTWLLGAGISCLSNVPLMYPLTDRVIELARNKYLTTDEEAIKIIEFIQADCATTAHIEHFLTHLTDLISIAERSRTGGVQLGGNLIKKAKLLEVHNSLLEIIACVIRWGYRPGQPARDGQPAIDALVGERGKAVADISYHLNFVRAIFGINRAGLDFVRTPVEFFTTNYDTLLEDALALSRVEFQDGFTGGGCAFWEFKNYNVRPGTRALITKLHGSIDWYRSRASVASVIRVRDGEKYPESGGSVMIWPQATKYANSQRDPFAELFYRFRKRLAEGSDHVLFVCGYSFGDEHINAELEMAMVSEKSQLTIVAFSDEGNDGLPDTLKEWRSKKPWKQRLFIASPKGIYRGTVGPLFGLQDKKRDWWTFSGVTSLFATGLPKDIQEALQ